MKMLAELKQLLGTDDIYYRNISEEGKIMDDKSRLDKIRHIINQIMERSEMSSELKELLGTDDIYNRNINKIMDDKCILNRIRSIINNYELKRRIRIRDIMELIIRRDLTKTGRYTKEQIAQFIIDNDRNIEISVDEMIADDEDDLTKLYYLRNQNLIRECLDGNIHELFRLYDEFPDLYDN